MHKLRRVVQRMNLVTTPSHSLVFDVAVKMTRERVGAIVVIDDERLVGIFTERDLMTRVVVAGRDPHATPISEVMTRDVITAELDEPVNDCVERMQRAGFRHLPVVQRGRVIHMLSMRDLLRDELDEQDEEIRSLRAYIHQIPVAT